MNQENTRPLSTSQQLPNTVPSSDSGGAIGNATRSAESQRPRGGAHVTIDYDNENINFAPKGRKNAIVQSPTLSSGLVAFLADYTGAHGAAFDNTTGKRREARVLGELEKHGGVTTTAYIHQNTPLSPIEANEKKTIKNASLNLESEQIQGFTIGTSGQEKQNNSTPSQPSYRQLATARVYKGDIETYGGVSGFSQSGLHPTIAPTSPTTPGRRHAEKRPAGPLTDTGLAQFLMTPRAQDITLVGSESASRSHMALRAFHDGTVNDVPFSPRDLDASKRFAFSLSPSTTLPLSPASSPYPHSSTQTQGGTAGGDGTPVGFSKQPMDLRDMQLPVLDSSTPEPANQEALEARSINSDNKYARKRKTGPDSLSEIDRLGGLVNHMFTPPPPERKMNIRHIGGTISDEGGLVNFQRNLPAYYPSTKGYIDPLLDQASHNAIPDKMKGELTLDGGLNRHLVLGSKEIPEGYLPALTPDHRERKKPDVEKAYTGYLDKVGGIGAHFASPIVSPPSGYLSPLPGREGFKKDRFPLDKAHQQGNIIQAGGLAGFLNTNGSLPLTTQSTDYPDDTLTPYKGEIDRAGNIYQYETVGSPALPEGLVASVTDPTTLRRSFEDPVLHKSNIDKFGLGAYAQSPREGYTVGAEDQLMHTRDGTAKIVSGRIVEAGGDGTDMDGSKDDLLALPDYKRTASLRELNMQGKDVEVERVREVPIRSGRIGAAALVPPCSVNDTIPINVDRRVVSKADALKESRSFRQMLETETMESLAKTLRSEQSSQEYSLSKIDDNKETKAVQEEIQPSTPVPEAKKDVGVTFDESMTGKPKELSPSDEEKLVKSLYFGTKEAPSSTASTPITPAANAGATGYLGIYTKQRSHMGTPGGSPSITSSPNVHHQHLNNGSSQTTPRPGVDTSLTPARSTVLNETLQHRTPATPYRLVADDDMHRLARVRKTIREMLPKKKSSAAALLRRKLVLRDTDNDGFITDIELYQVLNDLAPGVSVSDVGFLTKFLYSENCSKAQQGSAGYSSSQVVEWITSNTHAGLLEHSRTGELMAQRAPESTRSNWQDSKQKWNEFRVQWEEKYGKPATKELDMDAKEPKVGPTWTRSSPLPFKVLHPAQRAPIPSPSVIPTE